MPSYKGSFAAAKKMAAEADVQLRLVDCLWGDATGVSKEFEGLSLPDFESDQDRLNRDQQAAARWNWLFDDPLFEIRLLTIRDRSAVSPAPIPGQEPEWSRTFSRISNYSPSTDLVYLLQRGRLDSFWASAWQEVIHRVEVRQAFEASAHELAEASHALGRAVVAQLHVAANESGSSGPSHALREQILDRLLEDWEQRVLGLGTFFWDLAKKAASGYIKSRRTRITRSAVFPIGDILLYQKHGDRIRSFIRDKVIQSPKPIALLAHSLGGIACVDMLASGQVRDVKCLVTAGSQAPLFNELDCLAGIRRGDPLPSGFPPWMNFYDRNDFLSFVASRIWPSVLDEVSDSGMPFPDSHGAYFSNPKNWEIIKSFLLSHV